MDAWIRLDIGIPWICQVNVDHKLTLQQVADICGHPDVSFDNLSTLSLDLGKIIDIGLRDLFLSPIKRKDDFRNIEFSSCGGNSDLRWPSHTAQINVRVVGDSEQNSCVLARREGSQTLELTKLQWETNVKQLWHCFLRCGYVSIN